MGQLIFKKGESEIRLLFEIEEVAKVSKPKSGVSVIIMCWTKICGSVKKLIDLIAFYHIKPFFWLDMINVHQSM